MGLISRVSSRTYRNKNFYTQISINMGRSRSRSPARRERSRSPPARRYNSADLHSVRIGGRDSLPGDVTREEVEEIFGKLGEIGDIYLPRDRDTRELRGFGFVRFVKKDEMIGEEVGIVIDDKFGSFHEIPLLIRLDISAF